MSCRTPGSEAVEVAAVVEAVVEVVAVVE